MAKNITIAEIAKLANVSKTTVSRVLNNKPDVLPATRERINQIIKEYDFHPNVFAKAITNKTTNTIGLLIPYNANYIFSNPFYYEIIRGISVEVNRHGYYLMFFYSETDNYLDALKQKRADGIILISPGSQHRDVVENIKKLNIPMVATSKMPGTNDITYVDIDNFYGGYLAVEHLISLGHKRIGFINGSSILASSADRLNGYFAALSKHAIPFDETLIKVGDTSIASGYREMVELLKNEDLTAVFVGSDVMAVGVISAINERGKNVPNDISVVGFDDIPLAGALKPPLTTIRQSASNKGALATQILIDLIERGKSDIKPRLDVELVIRESTKSLLK